MYAYTHIYTIYLYSEYMFVEIYLIWELSYFSILSIHDPGIKELENSSCNDKKCKMQPKKYEFFTKI